MNLKKKIKGFFTLTRKADGGFTLVELIVVIAILAILAGVAVPAYSGYVTQANKQADMTLVSEVEQALTLRYYENSSDFSGSAIVCITPAGMSAESGSEAFVNPAMEMAFGESWNTLALSYDDWANNYAGTSFDGSEELLLTKVDGLTETLGETIYNASGDNFKNFLTTNGLTEEDAGDGTVLYVAHTTANLTPEQQKKFIASIESSRTFDTMITNLAGGAFGELNDTNVVAATAAYYAIAEAYNTKNNLGVTLDTTGIKDVETAGNAVMAFFGAIVEKQGDEGKALMEYLANGSAAADAQAYLDVMTTVNGAKSMVISNNNVGGFASLANIFSGYGDGNVYVYLLRNSDGSVEVSNTLPQA